MTRSRGRAQIVVAVAALVLLGATAGIAADRLLYRHPPADAVRLSDGTVVRLADMHADPIEVFDRALGLRAEQRTRVAAIHERRQADINAAWHEARTRLRATIDTVIAEIAAELDPDQADRFRTLVKELHGSPREGFLHH